jgi:hypothetical protein
MLVSPILNKVAGIAGMMNLRVTNTVMIDVLPKRAAVLKSIPFLLTRVNTPTRLVHPTTNKEYEVASCGGTENKYTITGTVRIEPPLPISPSETPIKMHAI